VTLHRFFVPEEQAAGERFPLPAAIERQVRGVLRMGDGDLIVLLTGDGSEATCRLEGGDCIVESRRPSAGEPGHRLTVVQALLKGDALEDVVRQATELGVASVRLVVTERCVARDLSPRKLERLRAIARESAEQSERGRIPDVGAPTSLAEVLQAGSVLLAEREDCLRLRDLEPPGSVIIGPEGGFSDRELDAARDAGVRLAGLGPRILRSRTVACAVTAAVLSRTGDFA
jgi:16S rRNA (uracil1498-N3)-methyltransferase